MKTVAFETRNPGRLALPSFGTIFMIVVLGFPAIALPLFTWRLVPESPVFLPIAYVVAFTPLAVIYMLKRLMSNYALRLFDTGEIELVLPFNTVTISVSDVAEIRATAPSPSQPAAVFVQFIAADGRIVTDVARNAFSRDDWSGFLGKLREIAPHVAIHMA